MRRGRRPKSAVLGVGALGLGLTLVAACATKDEPEIGPDCRALLELGDRAAVCAPDLASIVAQTRAGSGEQDCSRVARTLLSGPPEPITRPRSLFETPDPGRAAPLTSQERAALRRFSLPATLEIELDVPPEPGVASTRAELGAMALTAGPDGALRAEVRPGAYPLRLHHAGQSSVYCIRLASCETTSVVAHGARLARQHGVVPGPC